MIEITPEIALEDSELEFAFTRAAGPGGQNVNKVASAVQVRWDVGASAALTPEVKQRLGKLAGKRMTADGVLVIEARRYRSQERNRQEALERLKALVVKALQPPKPRRPTRPSAAARQRRLQAKKQQSEKKRRRRQVDDWG